MKRLLVVTYYWPPSSGSGVQRWLKFSKYLPQMGWKPVIYTPENPDFTLRDESLLAHIPEASEIIKRPIWEPYGLYRKLAGKSGTQDNTGITPTGSLARAAGWVRGTFFLPDPRRFWVGPSVHFLKRYLQDHPVDALVTTGPPHSMHLIGLGIKRHLPHLPWLADMRDPWATFDIHTSFMSEHSRKKNARMQQEVLDRADRVIITSPGTRREFPTARPGSLLVIHNGFDPDDLESLPPPAQETRFRIVHSGLLNSIRDVPLLWSALSKAIQIDPAFGDALRLDLIGNIDPQIENRLQEDSILGPRVRIREWLPHTQLLHENQTASIFLVIVNQSENAASQLPGKIYEYLALKKPLLAVCPSGSAMAEWIQTTRSGVALDGQNENAMVQALLKLWGDHHEGMASPQIDAAITQFSRETLTHKLVEVLEELVTR